MYGELGYAAAYVHLFCYLFSLSTVFEGDCLFINFEFLCFFGITHIDRY
jgi:hypothetical protein